MRHIFMINPAAGKTDISAKLRDEITFTCNKLNIDPLIFISEYAGYEREMTEKMCSLFSNEEIRIYSCGGSGTLDQILSGVQDFNTTEVACYPCGLTNDLLKCYGKNVENFHSIRNLIEGKVDILDILNINNFRVANFINFGLSNNQYQDTLFLDVAPITSSKISYVSATLKDIFTNYCGRYDITIDGKDYSGSYCMVICFNGLCMGGSLMPLSDPRPNDGYMNVVLIDEIPRLERLKLFNHIMYGKLDRHNPNVHIITAKELSVFRKDGNGILTFNCDGEIISADNNSASIRLIPNQLKFVVPQDAELLIPMNQDV